MEGFSIVVCTYNGKKMLAKSLPYLANLKNDGFDLELIVVDNNSNDGTYDYVKEVWKNFQNPYPLNLLTEKKTGKFHASVKAFNAAKYENIIICDDDNMLDENFCIIAHSLLKANPSVGIIGSYGLPEFEGESPVWFNHFQHIFACGHQAKQNGLISDKSAFIWGAGMVFKKKIWDTIHQQLKYTFLLNEIRTKNESSGGDDSELVEIARWLGYDLFYDNRLRYKHFMPENRMNLTYLKKRFRGLGKSRIYLRAYQYCFSNSELPDKALNYPFWKDKLKYRKKERNLLFLKKILKKNTPENYNELLKYEALVGEINEIKKLKDAYIDIFRQLFVLKDKIKNYNEQIDKSESI